MIEFKGKAKKAVSGRAYVKVPKFTTKHCDMAVMRNHAKYESVSNSNMFERTLAKLSVELFPTGYLWLDKIPGGVSVNTSKFLAVVKIEV